ncbi:superoxide dismutase [Loktanella sp. SALINAS62]|uniref:superoxide dismutase n=1 Tax=Loktanella sp. SALINAS62 TaxID=2706124 RepID=UPI001B8C342A|nr:superoxide dismutase [Loktanella sp. SALINAS62]MBS1303546.1 superoxide dismutase [Loktanella sp. SALINAS62]
MAFELPDLPYAHDALASKGMSKETLEYHHDKHHNAYATKTADMVKGSEWDGKSIEEIVKGTFDASSVTQSGLFDNASQYWNHCQFWEMMSPGDSKMPSELEKAITDSFGSVDAFKDEFKTKGGGQFGSGWVWLVKDTDGGLKVTNTANGINPLCYNQTALLGCDVWEHAYYLDHRNARPAYIDNFLNELVDWDNVAGRM